MVAHQMTSSVLSALAVEYKTPNNYGYQYFWFSVGTRESIIFSVAACKEVHIALAKFPGAYTYDTASHTLFCCRFQFPNFTI